MNYRERQKRARRQRGAIFVETLVVGSMLIVCISFIWAILQLTSAKQQSLSTARSDAWIHALNGCGDDNVTQAYDDLHERSKEPVDVCAGEDCANGEQIAGLTQGEANPPDWFAVDPGPEGSASQVMTDGLFQGKNVGSTRTFSCNPRQNRKILNLGSWHDELVKSVKKIFNEEAPPPYWEKEFTDGANNTGTCEEGSVVNGLTCRGDFCDNVNIRCQDWGVTPGQQTSHGPLNSCQGYGCCRVGATKTVSEQCPPNSFVTQIKCGGCYCRLVSFTCTAFENVTATDCSWTSEDLSEEDGGKILFDPDRAVAGIECSGKNCDNMRFYVCTLSGI